MGSGPAEYSMLLFCVKTTEGFTHYWALQVACLKKQEKHFVSFAACLVISWSSSVPLGVFLVTKTLVDEWYMVIKAHKFTIFERFLHYHIHVLRVHTIPRCITNLHMPAGQSMARQLQGSTWSSLSLRGWPLTVLFASSFHSSALQVLSCVGIYKRFD